MAAKKQDFTEESFFDHTRMSLGDHIEELRGALWRAIKGFIIAMILGFAIAKPVLNFLISPLHKVLTDIELTHLNADLEKAKASHEQLEEVIYLNARELAEKLRLANPESYGPDERISLTKYVDRTTIIKARIAEIQRVGPDHVLTALSVTEPFMIWFKVSLYAGLVLASPWIFYQIWMFVAAGLYPHEKRYIHVFLPLSIFLFVGGVCLCQFVVLPVGIRWLLEFGEWIGVKPDLRLSEWFSFALLVPLIFGIAFQLPLVMFALERVGVFEVETYTSKRRIAIFLLFLISGLANASPDPYSMVMLAVPMCLLYEFGIVLCRVWPRPEVDLDVEESEEMVEV